MSIEIKKNLNIKSLDYFYKLIRSNDELLDKHYKFAAFHDYMYDYYNGCVCSQDQFLNLSEKEYDDISKSDECISILIEHFSCDSIIFNK